MRRRAYALGSFKSQRIACRRKTSADDSKRTTVDLLAPRWRDTKADVDSASGSWAGNAAGSDIVETSHICRNFFRSVLLELTYIKGGLCRKGSLQ